MANPFAAGQRMYRTGDLVVWREVEGGQGCDRLPRPHRLPGEVPRSAHRAGRDRIRAAGAGFGEPGRGAGGGYGASASNWSPTSCRCPAAQIDSRRCGTRWHSRCPRYMIPGAIVALDAFPLNPAASWIARRCPSRCSPRASIRAPATADRGDRRRGVRRRAGRRPGRLGRRLLRLGGNSLVAAQVVARLGAALDARVPVRVLFETSTVAALAAAVESQARRQPGRGWAVWSVPSGFRCRSRSSGCGSSTGSIRSRTAYNMPSRCGCRAHWTWRRCGPRSAIWSPATRCCAPCTRGRQQGPVQVILPAAQAVRRSRSRGRARGGPNRRCSGSLSTTFDVTVEVPLRVAAVRGRSEPRRARAGDRRASHRRRRLVDGPAGAGSDDRLCRTRGGRGARLGAAGGAVRGLQHLAA